MLRHDWLDASLTHVSHGAWRSRGWIAGEARIVLLLWQASLLSELLLLLKTLLFLVGWLAIGAIAERLVFPFFYAWIGLHYQLLVRLSWADRACTRARVEPFVGVLTRLLWLGDARLRVRDQTASFGWARVCTHLYLVLLSTVGQYLTRIEHLVQDLVYQLVTWEELIIKLWVSGGEDPTEVLHPTKLFNCLSHQVSESQLRACFHRIYNFEVLLLILLHDMVY